MNNTHKLNVNDFILDEIESITFLGEDDTVDIEVDDTHMFFANDVYSHNSGAETEIISGEQISEDYSKIMIGDFIFSVSRKIEDQVHKTARVFIIKNRFGVDKITFPAKFDVSNGNLSIYEEKSTTGQELKTNMNNSQNNLKKLLRDKYTKTKNDKKDDTEKNN